MSIPASQKRFMPVIPSNERATQSPQTPRSTKLTRESRTPLSVKSSKNKSVNRKEKQESINTKNTGTPISSAKTYMKKSQTPAKRTLIGVLKEKNNYDRTCTEDDSFSTVVLEDKENNRLLNQRASLLLESRNLLETNDGDSSIKVAVRVRPFSER